jgi:hypothetical protein
MIPISIDSMVPRDSFAWQDSVALLSQKQQISPIIFEAGMRFAASSLAIPSAAVAHSFSVSARGKLLHTTAAG